MSNIIFIAPPAAGKGTQAELLKEKYNMAHISMGDLLRNEVNSNSPLGEHIKTIMEEGKLVENKTVFELLEKRLLTLDVKEGYILDGFPREFNQVLAYENLSVRLHKEVDYVIYLHLDEDKASKRILGRVSCPNCGAVYNEYTDTFDKIGFCNKCSTKLVKRNDDNIETFKHRFQTYLSNTKPILDYYDGKGLLYIVDGSANKTDIFKRIEKIISGVVEW